jgi:hypothetical protein
MESNSRINFDALIGLVVVVIGAPLFLAFCCLCVGVLARAWHWMVAAI